MGSDVTGWNLGDAVAVQSNLFCGECEFCLRGDDSLCLRGQLLGVQLRWRFRRKSRSFPRARSVRLPAGVDFDTSAALTLAGSTAMHMLTNRTQVHPGRLGARHRRVERRGFRGHSDCQSTWAHASSAPAPPKPSGLSPSVSARNLWSIPTIPKWPAEVRKLTEKRGVDLVVEHVGGEVLQIVFDCLARGGTVVTCGATAGREVPINLWPFFVKQQRLIGSYGRNRADIEATLEWAAAGKLSRSLIPFPAGSTVPRSRIRPSRASPLAKCWSNLSSRSRNPIEPDVRGEGDTSIWFNLLQLGVIFVVGVFELRWFSFLHSVLLSFSLLAPIQSCPRNCSIHFWLFYHSHAPSERWRLRTVDPRHRSAQPWALLFRPFRPGKPTCRSNTK